MRCSTSELTAHLGGELVGPDVSIEGASIDSRTIRPGQLYAPIVAERDGHAFIPAALEAAAPARPPPPAAGWGAGPKRGGTPTPLLGLRGLSPAWGWCATAVTPGARTCAAPRVRAMAPLSACRVLGYGVSADADVRADQITLDGDLRARFRLSSPWGQTEVRLALHGVHQVANALAAATVALWCGVPVET